MEGNTPGQATSEAAPAGAVEAPAEAAEEQVASTPQEPAAQQEQEKAPEVWTPDALPETERERARKWAEAEAEKYHLRKVGEQGGWMRDMPGASREKVKRDPLYIDRLEAQLDELRKVAGGGGVAPKRETEVKPDRVEGRAAKLKEKFKLADGDADLVREVLKEAVEVAREELSDPIVEKTVGHIQQQTLNEKFNAIQASPEWQDMTEKGEELRERFLGRLQLNRDSNRREDPTVVYESLKARLFGRPSNPSPAHPKPKPSMGDTPSGALKPPAGGNATALQQYEEKLRASGVDPRFF